MESFSESGLYEFEDFRIDGGKRLLWNDGKALSLTPKAFDTLFYLVRNAGETVGKDDLMAAVWPDTVVEENNLNKHISALRQSLGEKRGEHRFIATIPGRGYKFVAPVTQVKANGSNGNGVGNAEGHHSDSASDKAEHNGNGTQAKSVPLPSWINNEDVDAHHLYVVGRHTAFRLTPQDHFKAIGYLRGAIQQDPNFAHAYAAINFSYYVYMLACDARPGDTLPEARAAALRAMDLNDKLPQSHVALARLAIFYEWNWEEGERHLLRARELDENDTESLMFLAHLYSNLGQHERALELARRARKLDPLTINRSTNEGQFLYYAARYDESFAHLQQTIELNPTHWLPSMFLARVYLEKGMYQEAIAECRRSWDLGSHSHELTALEAWAHVKLGEADKARASLKELETLSKLSYVPPYYLALVHNALGETDMALSWLEKAYAAKDVRMVFMKIDPKFDNLRSEPRYQALAKLMKYE